MNKIKTSAYQYIKHSNVIDKTIWVLSIFCIVLVFIIFPFDAGALQVLFQILLLPTIIIGFRMTVLQLKQMQETPDLEVLWTSIKTDEVTIEVPKYNQKELGIQVLLANNGSTSTNWFNAQLEFPIELLVHPDNLNLRTRIVGNEYNWKNSRLVDEKGNVQKVLYTFMSNGQVSAFPKYTMPLGVIVFNLFPNVHYPKECTLSYSIISDKTAPRIGHLRVKLEPENLSKKIPSEWLLENLLIREMPPTNNSLKP